MTSVGATFFFCDAGSTIWPVIVAFGSAGFSGGTAAGAAAGAAGATGGAGGGAGAGVGAAAFGRGAPETACPRRRASNTLRRPAPTRASRPANPFAWEPCACAWAQPNTLGYHRGDGRSRRHASRPDHHRPRNRGPDLR